ncbi:FeoA family protein [Desulfosarcina alkanivorans]
MIKQKTSRPSFPLAMAGDGEMVRIVSFRHGRNFQERLLSMGIQLDDVVKVQQRRDKGAVVISKENTRYALGGGMALKIHVIKET